MSAGVAWFCAGMKGCVVIDAVLSQFTRGEGCYEGD